MLVGSRFEIDYNLASTSGKSTAFLVTVQPGRLSLSTWFLCTKNIKMQKRKQVQGAVVGEDILQVLPFVFHSASGPCSAEPQVCSEVVHARGSG